MVDAWCDAVGSEERPLFGKLLEGRWSQKRGGAKGGAPTYKGQTRARLALSPCGPSPLSLSGPEALSAPPSRCSALSLSLSRSCACGPTSGLLVETRTEGAAVPAVWWTCASRRGVPERVRRPRGRPEPGATTLTVVGETRRPLKGGLFFCFCVCVCGWRRVRQVRTE